MDDRFVHTYRDLSGNAPCPACGHQSTTVEIDQHWTITQHCGKCGHSWEPKQETVEAKHG